MNALATLLRHRELIWQLAVRDVKVQTRGNILGIAWLVISPLVQAAAYALIVSFVFAKTAASLQYAAYVLTGMAAWQFMARTIHESCGLIRDRMELVKQVVYPIETLPAGLLLSTSISAMVTLGIAVILQIASDGIAWSIILFPLHIALLVVFLLGCAWIFSIIGAVAKDVRDALGVLLGLAVYGSPTFLSQEMVGATIWNVILLNPLSHPVICLRDVMSGSFHASSWVVFAILSLATFVAGQLLMSKTKKVINEYL